MLDDKQTAHLPRTYEGSRKAASEMAGARPEEF